MQENLYIKYIDFSLLFCYNSYMNLTQIQPEALIVTRDGQLDDDYYDMVYEDKRHNALVATRKQLISSVFIGTPRILGRGLMFVLKDAVGQGN